MNASLKKFLVLCALTSTLAVGACKDPYPTAMSTPQTSTPQPTESENITKYSIRDESSYDVDIVRDPADFHAGPTSYAFRADSTTCWVDMIDMIPQCELTGTEPMRVILAGNEWRPVNEGPGATPTPQDVEALNRGETLAVENLVANHGDDGTLRISFPRQNTVPPLIIRDGEIVGE